MSVKTDNEYTSFMFKMNEIEKRLGQATFSVQEVMFLMEMTNFRQGAQENLDQHERDA